MAKIVITLEDGKEEDQVAVRFDYTPAVDTGIAAETPPPPPTTAQRLAMGIGEYIRMVSGGDGVEEAQKGDVDDDFADEPLGPACNLGDSGCESCQ